MSEKDKYTRDEDKRFTLRINKELFAKLEESARKHKRAIGREIEYILELELSDKTFATREDAINSLNVINSELVAEGKNPITITEEKLKKLYSRDDL